MTQLILQSCNSAILQSQAFSTAAASGVVHQFSGYAGVAFLARGGKFQHPGHLALAEDRIAEDLVVHVAALGNEARVLNVAYDLSFVHAVTVAGGAGELLYDPP